MSDVWFNLRIGIFHIQIQYGSWIKFRFSKNSFWRADKENNYGWLKAPVALYDFRPIFNIECIRQDKRNSKHGL